LKKIWNQYGLLIVIAGFLITCDQITKALVRTYLPVEGQTWSALAFLEPYARIIHITNTGVAFGMFKGMGWVFAILAVIVAGVIVYYYPKVEKKEWLLRVALALQFSGAVGNLIDRILYGKVIDFISVGNFAIWNVADASITVGVALMVLSILIQEFRERSKKRNSLEMKKTGKG
jgi:signal peptidase II